MQKVLPGVGVPPPHSPPEDCTPCWPRPCPRWPPRSASPRGCPGPRGGSPPAAPARSPRGWGWSWRAGGGWTRCRRGAARGCGRGTWGQPLTTLTSAAHLTDQFAPQLSTLQMISPTFTKCKLCSEGEAMVTDWTKFSEAVPWFSARPPCPRRRGGGWLVSPSILQCLLGVGHLIMSDTV